MTYRNSSFFIVQESFRKSGSEDRCIPGAMMALKLYLVSALVMLVLDVVWLSSTSSFFVNQFAGVGRIEDGKIKIIYWSAALVYLLMPLAVQLFALPRIAPEDSWAYAAGIGALLGLVIYGIYDGTNHATLRSWPVPLMVVDISWGIFLFATTTCVTKIARDHWL